MSVEAPEVTRARITRFSDVFDHRHDDFALDEQQTAIRSMIGGLLDRAAPIRPRDPVVFDVELRQRVASQGLHGMSLPASAGGDGGALLDAGLVADAVGQHVASIGFVEGLVAARLLAGLDDLSLRPVLDAFADASGCPTIALLDADGAPAQPVPSGAVADHVVVLRGDRLVLATVTDPTSPVPNAAALPLQRLDTLPLGEEVELASGPDARARHRHALREWRVLTAALVTGVADGANRRAVEFAVTRQTRGVPIGSLQAISHALADARIAVDVARGLWQKAAWYLEHEPGTRPFQDRVALVSAARAGTGVTTTAVHVHGGAGLSLESDVSLFFRRAKAWAGLAGDPESHLARIGRDVLEAS